MAENRNYYTAPDVVERAVRASWPELNFRLREQIGHGGMSDVYKLSAAAGSKRSRLPAAPVRKRLNCVKTFAGGALMRWNTPGACLKRAAA